MEKTCFDSLITKQIMDNWTIQKLLNWTTTFFTDKKIEAARLSAELLLSETLGLKRIELYTQFDKVVAKADLDKLHGLVKRAGDNEPVAYLIGRTEFYSIELDIDNNCLIPRPETELLVERAIEFLRKRNGKQFVLDLCTGSGCIAVAIAINCPDVNIIATDICDDALKVAHKNVQKYDLNDRIKLLCGDLFDPVIPQIDEDKFDLIVCNPPYVTESEYLNLDKNVRDYEPASALIAGVDGLDVYRRIAERADSFLKNESVLMLEIGYNQGCSVRELLEKCGYFNQIEIERDFNNNDRIVIAKLK